MGALQGVAARASVVNVVASGGKNHCAWRRRSPEVFLGAAFNVTVPSFPTLVTVLTTPSGPVNVYPTGGSCGADGVTVDGEAVAGSRSRSPDGSCLV